jgi:hypothetical protein
MPVSEGWIQARLNDARWTIKARERLQRLSWFMNRLKEPLSLGWQGRHPVAPAFAEGKLTVNLRVDPALPARLDRVRSATSRSEAIKPDNPATTEIWMNWFSACARSKPTHTGRSVSKWGWTTVRFRSSAACPDAADDDTAFR